MKNPITSMLSALILSLAAFGPSYAQKAEMETTAIADDLKMTTWPGDTIAEAGVLYDKGNVKFYVNSADTGFDIHFTRSTKIKIFKESGVKYGTIEVPLYFDKSNSETVDRVKAVVYNTENGQMKSTGFNTNQVYEEKINNNWKVKKFALPNVKPGSVIEYSYTVITPFKFNLPDWEFQWDIPVRMSRFSASIIPFYEYMFLFQGANKFDRQLSYVSSNELQFGPAKYKEMNYEYEVQNVPAFRDEDYITSRKDYIKKIDFQLTSWSDVYGSKTSVMTSWKALSREMLNEESYGKYINACKRDCKDKATFDASLDTLGNVKKAIEAMKSQFTWNKSYALTASQTLKEFLTQKTGSSANINLYAIGMLNAMGIDAKPLMISTRNHGKIISDYPFVNAFNHNLIYVSIGGNIYLCDATDPYYPFDILPAECINNKGYLVDGKSSDTWLSLANPKGTSDMGLTFELTVDPSTDEIEAKTTVIASSHDAVKLRKRYINDKSQFQKSLMGNLEVGKLEVENLEDKDKRFIANADIVLNAERSGDKLFVHPFIGLCDQQNMFKAETRDYLVDLTYNFRRNFTSQLTVPKGYKVTSMPTPITITDPLLQFTYSVNQNDDKVIINGVYLFTKSVYQAEEYLKLKKTFNTIVTKLNQGIVLEKSENPTL